MDRRRSGSAILVIALFAAIVGSARTKQISGTPMSAPVPAPPTVGDCLLQPAPATVDELHAPSGPPTDLGPCSGPRYGEVMAVLTDPDPAVRDHPAGLERVGTDLCAGTFQEFLGARNRRADGWQTGLMIGATVVEPSALQRAAGQNWLACLVQPFGAAAIRYTGSLRRVLTTEQYPPELARCLRSLPQDSTFRAVVPCTAPHPAEILGWRLVDPGTTAAAIRASCRSYAARLTGMADPTAGGRLIVVAQIDMAMPAAAESNGRHRAVGSVCAITATGGRQLTGPLLGLGDRPVPVG